MGHKREHTCAILHKLCALDPEKREKSFGYIMDSARVVTLMGGTRVVFHPGSEKGGHDEAMERALEFLRECIARLDAQGYSVSDIIHILMAEGGQA